MRLIVRLGVLLAALLLTTAGVAPAPVGATSPDAAAHPTAARAARWTPSFPIRAAFYYPWFPETWGPAGDRYTHYHPSRGWYDSAARRLIDAHIGSMLYAGLHVGIASWWGPGSHTDSRMPALLAGAAGKPFRWTVYVEEEGTGDPSAATISQRLTYLERHYAHDPSYLRVHGKPVVFVYADPGDGCGMVRRWKAGNAGRFYVVLKDFPGYERCAVQPDDWHQYAPAGAVQTSTGSFTVSPGFWHAKEGSPRLVRKPTAFAAEVARMARSGKRWQLVTTWNEWGEGTAVESAREWATRSGQGRYADILHRQLVSRRR
jgi:hypothetical protein